MLEERLQVHVDVLIGGGVHIEVNPACERVESAKDTVAGRDFDLE